LSETCPPSCSTEKSCCIFGRRRASRAETATKIDFESLPIELRMVVLFASLPIELRMLALGGLTANANVQGFALAAE